MSRLLTCLACLLLLAQPGGVLAEGIDVTRASVDLRDDAYVINADFAFELKARQEDALNKGLSLYFAVEFEVTRSRWYWFDEKVVTQQQQRRLTYQPLTRQYRLSTGALHQNFPTLDEALRSLARVRSWPVSSRAQLNTGDTYLGALRMRLDVAQLPKPFQVDALTSRDWVLSSDWKRWQFTLTAPVQEAAPSPVGQEGAAR